ncbi:hypothetical protein HHI36_010432 [Cryptolaemus montrouzieri]|uniref:Uncharacterized protein n=1 Tax=Cryptolaemus montrouzieri TaxID=559131 RepID=A0ABD2MIW5_9CUCU
MKKCNLVCKLLWDELENTAAYKDTDDDENDEADIIEELESSNTEQEFDEYGEPKEASEAGNGMDKSQMDETCANKITENSERKCHQTINRCEGTSRSCRVSSIKKYIKEKFTSRIRKFNLFLKDIQDRDMHIKQMWK